MKCTNCGNNIYLQSSDDEPHKIDNTPVCETCYFNALGECIEKHPIGLPLVAIHK
jgi:uncharacterized protein (DUF983 family)